MSTQCLIYAHTKNCLSRVGWVEIVSKKRANLTSPASPFSSDFPTKVTKTKSRVRLQKRQISLVFFLDRVINSRSCHLDKSAAKMANNLQSVCDLCDKENCVQSELRPLLLNRTDLQRKISKTDI